LFTTFTTGAVGVVLGAATPEPCKLVHPLALLLPYKLQLFEQLLKQLIQCSIIKFCMAVDVEVPSQLFTTFTGAVGVVLGRQRLNLVNLYIHLH
jgi:hypothetical protein